MQAVPTWQPYSHPPQAAGETPLQATIVHGTWLATPSFVGMRPMMQAASSVWVQDEGNEHFHSWSSDCTSSQQALYKLLLFHVAYMSHCAKPNSSNSENLVLQEPGCSCQVGRPGCLLPSCGPLSTPMRNRTNSWLPGTRQLTPTTPSTLQPSAKRQCHTRSCCRPAARIVVKPACIFCQFGSPALLCLQFALCLPTQWCLQTWSWGRDIYCKTYTLLVSMHMAAVPEWSSTCSVTSKY